MYVILSSDTKLAPFGPACSQCRGPSLGGAVRVDGGGRAAPGCAGRYRLADAGGSVRAAQFRRGLAQRQFSALVPEHAYCVRRHPRRAVGHGHRRRLRLRASDVPRPGSAVCAVPAAAAAGAAAVDRAEPADIGVTAPLRQTARHHGALFRLGLWHLPDAPDLSHDPARLRGSGDARRRHDSGADPPRARAVGAAGSGGLRNRFGDGALERIPVAADGGLLAVEPGV